MVMSSRLDFKNFVVKTSERIKDAVFRKGCGSFCAQRIFALAALS
jgi:hypothetical protein